MITTTKPDRAEALCLKVYLRKGYPQPWKDQRIQKIMRQWANHHCEHCGCSGDDSLLHVHHLVWNDKHDCRWENLLVCCVSCHTAIHNHKWQPGKPWMMGPTPEWMTKRGFENPADQSTALPVQDNRAAALTWLLLLGVISVQRAE